MIPFNNLELAGDEKERVLAAMQRVVDSGWYILGKEVAAFEEAFAASVGAKYAIGVANGLEALQIALMALGIGPGDEVITTSFSAAATALAIRAVGAAPVFADIDDYFDIDPAEVEKLITKRTKAIIPVHLYGQPCDLDALAALAKKHGVALIEDCAQSHGAVYRGRTSGSVGTFGCFSFYPTKNLGALGDAGALTTSNPELAEKCRMIRNYGQKNRYEHEVYGINSRLDELQAAILGERLAYLPARTKRRQELALLYRRGLAGVAEVSLPQTRAGAESVYHLFVIETKKRDELRAFLKDEGIETQVHYPIPIHKQKSFASHNNLSLPRTEAAVARVLSLPLYPTLTDETAAEICAKIKKFYA